MNRVTSENSTKIIQDLYDTLTKHSDEDVIESGLTINIELSNDIYHDTISLFDTISRTSNREKEFSRIIQSNEEIFYIPSLAYLITESFGVNQCSILEKHYIINAWVLYCSNPLVLPEFNIENKEIEVGQQEFNKIGYSAGWVIKRVKETIKDTKELKLLTDNSGSFEYIARDDALKVLSLVYTEVQHEGRYIHVPNDELCNFFIRLHSFVDSLMLQTDKKNLNSNSKDLIIIIIQKTLVHKPLRDEWISMCKDESKVAALFCFKCLVSFFMKIKQKMVLKQLNLTPNKKSLALRQAIKTKVTKKEKKMKKDKTKKPNSNNEEDLIVQQLRSTDTSLVAQSLTKLKQTQEINSIISKIQGNTLTKILKSLALPARTGKAKSKQLETLMKYLNSIDTVEIKNPSFLL